MWYNILSLIALVYIIFRMERTSMQIDDLKAAVARVGASTSAEIKAVSDKLSALGSDNPDIAAAITQLNTAADTLDSETATLTAPVTPV